MFEDTASKVAVAESHIRSGMFSELATNSMA